MEVNTITIPMSQVRIRVSESHSLCDPMDYTVDGILQARKLEWVAFPFSRVSSQPQELNPDLLHCRQIFYQLSYEGSPCLNVV